MTGGEVDPTECPRCGQDNGEYAVKGYNTNDDGDEYAMLWCCECDYEWIVFT